MRTLDVMALASPSPPPSAHSKSKAPSYFAPQLASPSMGLSTLSLGPAAAADRREGHDRRTAPPAAPIRKEQDLDDRTRTAAMRSKSAVHESESTREASKEEVERPRTPEQRQTAADQDDLPAIPLSPDHLPAGFPSPKKHADGPESYEDETEDAEGRPRFVGNPAIRRDTDEPILQENKRRFVLFPIQYSEVRDAILSSSQCIH